VACLLLVLTLFDAMAGVRSAEMHDRIVEFLAKPPGDGLSLTVSGAIDLLRGLLLVSGALAAAGVVLGVFALLRHRGARVGLSVVAVLMLLSATFVSVLPVVVAVAAAMLWGRDARDWFDGRAPRPRPARDTPAEGPAPGMTAWQPGAGAGDAPPAPTTYPYGAPRPASGQHPGPPGPPAHLMAGAGVRPAAVTAVVWLTWVFSALVAFFFLIAVLVILVDSDTLLARLQASESFAGRGFTRQGLLGTLWVVSATAIFWSLCAMALAALVMMRVEIARRVLMVSSALAGIIALVAVPVGWVHAAVAFTCLGLLHRRSTRDWFAGRDAQPPAAPPGPPGGHQDPSAWPPPQPTLPPTLPPSQPPSAQHPPREKPPVW
jgi:hypothetical protein